MGDETYASAESIAVASSGIDPVFLMSPFVEQATANAELGCRLLAKVETLNPIRCFKGRGAGWWVANLADQSTPIVSASAGNFGQGLAYAAARNRRRLIVFASVNANPKKIAAMQRLGAEVVQEGEDFDAAKLEARSFAGTNGFIFAEDGADRYIAEGAGTIAKEITDALSRNNELDALVVPLGNGALLTGMATWMRATSPECRVVGVVAAQAPAMKLSWEQNNVVSTPSASTIADGIAVRIPVPYAIRSMQGLVDEVVAVDEDAIQRAISFCQIHYGLIVEPAGAVGVAAILSTPENWRNRIVATVLCGGNVAPPD